MELIRNPVSFPVTRLNFKMILKDKTAINGHINSDYIAGQDRARNLPMRRNNDGNGGNPNEQIWEERQSD